MPEIQPLLDAVITAVITGNPQLLARQTRQILEESRILAQQGEWSSIATLAHNVDEAIAAARRSGRIENQQLKLVADLSQQILTVLVLTGDSNGNRDSGYYRAANSHAQRIDTMTDGRLGLAALVDLIRD